MNLFRLIYLLSLLLISYNLPAQEVLVSKTFEPHSGQQGKDVVWVPTSEALVEKMLDLAKVTPNDFVIDLGSGDGRTVISAAKRGAKARGVEYDPNMIALSKDNAQKEGVTDKVEFLQGDLFEADLSKASVITLFLLTNINLKLRPSLLELKPGTRIVSNTFRMGDWEPDATARAEEGCNSWCEALLWIVPAKVDGSWRMPTGELIFDQKYQIVTGTMKMGKSRTKISAGRLKGNEITFIIDDNKYQGIINGNKIEGIVNSGKKITKWNAVKAVN